LLVRQWISCHVLHPCPRRPNVPPAAHLASICSMTF
jgi:hypothetical protein